MKYKKLLTGLVITAAVTATSVGFVCTTAGASNTDPLVTLSYLNNTVIPKITEDVKNAVLEIIKGEDGTVEDNVVETPTEAPAETPETPTEAPTEETPTEEIDLSALKYTVVSLSQGQKLMAKGADTESTEIILRSGTATAIPGHLKIKRHHV